MSSIMLKYQEVNIFNDMTSIINISQNVTMSLHYFKTTNISVFRNVALSYMYLSFLQSFILILNFLILFENFFRLSARI